MGTLKLAALIGIVTICIPSVLAEPIRLNSSHGRFSTPNYPSPYENNMNMSWEIRAEEGYKIGVRFLSFELEDSYDDETDDSCLYDYLRISENKSDITRICGSALRYEYMAPSPRKMFYSKGNEMDLEFISDYSNEKPYKGFRAKYRTIDRDECAELKHKQDYMAEDWDLLLVCSHFCFNTPGSYLCDCKDGYMLHENKHTCIAKQCQERQQLNEDQGSLTSPGYPDEYSSLTDCDWTIKVRKGLSINLAFNTEVFDLESHVDYGCQYDYVEVSYNTVEGNNLKQRLCGQEPIAPDIFLTTNVAEVVVKFHSDLSVSGKGFKLDYTTTRVKCREVIGVPMNGSLINPKDDYDYRFEDTLSMDCDIGYNIVGNQTITCQNDGTWSSPIAHCEIVSCGRPPHLDIRNLNTDNIAEVWTYTQEFEVNCNKWYELTAGDSHYVCNSTGDWVIVRDMANTVLPKCTPECGQRNGDLNKIQNEDNADYQQIAGGKDAKENEWPWMALLKIPLYEGPITCGGSLITDKHIVTAAHCVQSLDEDDIGLIEVYLGLHALNDLKNINSNSIIQAFHALKLNIHDRWNGLNDASNYENDIAIIELDSYVTLKAEVLPICIPQTQIQQNLFKNAADQVDGHQKSGVVTGWGYKDIGDESSKTLSDILQKVRLKPVTNTECAELINESINQSLNQSVGEANAELIRVTDNFICAGHIDFTKDACHGDSGGPFAIKDPRDNKYFLIGIVSFGDLNKCGTSRAFGLYTNVPNYIPWIKNHID